MKTPTKTPEFSDCYGSFEECYKNKCTCRCHSQENTNTTAKLGNHMTPTKKQTRETGSPDTNQTDDEILNKIVAKWKDKWDIKHHSKVWWEDMLKEAIALTREACEKVHTHIKPNCELCFAMWKAGFEDGQKAVLKDSEDKK